MNNVTQYTQFSGNPDEQNGHYLVLKINSEDAESITTKMTGEGSSGKVTKVTDNYCVYLIKDAKKQKIEITATKSKDSRTITYDLSGLSLSE